jgi:hypothetical protein
MASGATTSNSGHVHVIDDIIDYPTIDNANASYWIETTLPKSTGAGDDVWGCSVFITYLRPVSETGILSLPVSSFSSFEDGYTYTASQSFITHFKAPTGDASGGYNAARRLSVVES